MELKIDESRIFGSVIALDFIAIPAVQPIMTLVFCHCHDDRSVLKVEQWFHKTDLK